MGGQGNDPQSNGGQPRVVAFLATLVETRAVFRMICCKPSDDVSYFDKLLIDINKTYPPPYHVSDVVVRSSQYFASYCFLLRHQQLYCVRPRLLRHSAFEAAVQICSLFSTSMSDRVL